MANHLASPGSGSVFGLSQGPPVCVRTHLLARMDSSEEALLGGGASSLFDLQGAFLRMCSQEGLLDFAHEEYVVLYLLSGQGSASPRSCSFGVSVDRGRTPAVQPGAHLPPASVWFQTTTIKGISQ